MEEKQATTPPTITVLVDGEHIDISYACEVDCEAETIELPDNLPGGSEVYVDGKYLTTTAVSLAERAEYLRNAKQGPKRRNLLAVAIGAVLYGGPQS